MPLINTVKLEFVALEVCLHCMCIPVFMCVCKIYISVCCVCVYVHKLEVDIRCLPLLFLALCFERVSLKVELADLGRLARR